MSSPDYIASKLRCWAAICLFFSILQLPTITGILGIIAASQILCCNGPTLVHMKQQAPCVKGTSIAGSVFAGIWIIAAVIVAGTAHHVGNTCDSTWWCDNGNLYGNRFSGRALSGGAGWEKEAVRYARDFLQREAKMFSPNAEPNTAALTVPGERRELQSIVNASAPHFRVGYGPCRLSSQEHDGTRLACVESSNFGADFGAGYGSNEICQITAINPGPITYASFDTEAIFDRLTINGQSYSGQAHSGNSWDLIGITPASSDITWRSDGSVAYSGWKICMSDSGSTPPVTPPGGSSPGTPTCVNSNIYYGSSSYYRATCSAVSAVGIVFIIIAVLQFFIFVSSIKLACWAGAMQACALEPKPFSEVVITTGAPMAVAPVYTADGMVVHKDAQQFSSNA